MLEIVACKSRSVKLDHFGSGLACHIGIFIFKGLAFLSQIF